MIPRQLGAIAAAAILCLVASNSHADAVPRIAIIMDDLGNQLAAGRRVIALPGPVVRAILPGNQNETQDDNQNKSQETFA